MKEVYEPNKAYVLYGKWEEVRNQLNKRNNKPVRVKLKLTPWLFQDGWDSAEGIARAKELGYMEMETWLGEDNNFHLRAWIDEDRGDEYGFGMDDHILVGIVGPDGVFVEPLHICRL